MFGTGRPEEIFVGILMLVLAALMARRVRQADATGEIPLWRRRATREELGDAKFKALQVINVAVTVLLITRWWVRSLGSRHATEYASVTPPPYTYDVRWRTR